MVDNFVSVSTKSDNFFCIDNLDEKIEKRLQIELSFLIDELMDTSQQTVAWMIYNSMKDSYSIDAVGFGLELWCNFCYEKDPIIDEESKYAASIELFISQFFNQTPYSKVEILNKYGLDELDELTLMNF